MNLRVWKEDGHWRYQASVPGMKVHGRRVTWKQALDAGLQELAWLAGL